MRGKLSRIEAAGLCILLLLLYAALVLLLSAGFSLPGPHARRARASAILTGRDDPDREPAELLPGQRLDLNTASAQQLRLLPGIGESLSQAIVDYRQANGPFESVEQLMDVPGIGPERYQAAAEHITVGPAPAG